MERIFVSELTANHPVRRFRFPASSGQSLAWEITGLPTVRILLRAPSGDTAGPDDLSNPVTLAESGDYEFEVTADTMADSAYGPFELKLSNG